jgi:hypothetical protein
VRFTGEVYLALVGSFMTALVQGRRGDTGEVYLALDSRRIMAVVEGRRTRRPQMQLHRFRPQMQLHTMTGEGGGHTGEGGVTRARCTSPVFVGA